MRASKKLSKPHTQVNDCQWRNDDRTVRLAVSDGGSIGNRAALSINTYDSSVLCVKRHATAPSITPTIGPTT